MSKSKKSKSNVSAPKGASAGFDKYMDELRYTRDFEHYLDMMNEVKDRYLIVLCLRDSTGQSISYTVMEKLHKLGFAEYTTAPDMKYVGILDNGKVICDKASPADRPPLYFEGAIEGTSLYFSFDKNELEISIDGEDHALEDGGLNFVVYDRRNSKLVEGSCYYAAEDTNPVFYHRNLQYNKQYIDSHIYMPKKYIKSATLPMRRSYFSNRRLGFKEVENAIVLPNKRVKDKTYGGVCDENFNFITGHQVHGDGLIADTYLHTEIKGGYEVPQSSVVEYPSDETVLYGGNMFDHPGHLMTEDFGDRIWWLLKNPDSNLKIAITAWIWLTDDIPFIKEFFEAFGVSEDRLIVVAQPTKFKKLIIPDQSAFPLYYNFPYEFTAEYISVFQHMRERLTPGKDKKIYLSKKQTEKQNIIGADYFDEFFRNRGFRIVYPEEHTLKEKAEMMYGAEEVVTIDGTNVNYVLFCKPSVRFTILARLPNFWNSPQQLINEAMGNKNFYLVNVSGTFVRSPDPWFEDFIWGLTLACVTKEFKKYVKDIYGEELEITTEESIKSNLYEYIAAMPEHYSSKLINFKAIKHLKFSDILPVISEVLSDDDNYIQRFIVDDDEAALAEKADNLKNENERLIKENEEHLEKIKMLSDKAKEIIDQNTELKYSISELLNEYDSLKKDYDELNEKFRAASGQKG